MIDEQKMRICMIAAFASHKNLYKKIDEHYLKNKYEAYRLAIKDNCYDTPVFKLKSIEFEVYCKQILGLFSIDEDYYINLFMKEDNEKLHSYLTSGEEEYDFVEILRLIYSGNENVEAIIDRVTVAIGYIRKFGLKLVNNKQAQTYEDMIENTFTGYGRDLVEDLLEKKKKRCRYVWSEFCSIYGVYQKPKIFSDILRGVSDAYRKDDDDQAGRFLLTISTITQLEGINSIFLLSCEITENDILICVQTYLDLIPEEIMPDYDALAEHMITGLFTIAWVKEFKKMKAYYFKHNQETVFQEMENYENIIKDQNDQLRQASIEIKKLREENDWLKQKRREA